MEKFIIIGGLAVFATIIIAARYSAKKRTEALETIASSLDFSFSKKGSYSLIASPNQFYLFSRGRSKKVSNVMNRCTNDIDVTIMDYRYTVGGGKNSCTWTQTVILFQSSLLRLPAFTLRPEHLFHKIGNAFGYKDIDFDSYPTFSKQYLLRGPDEEAVRNFFTDRLLAHYDEHKGLNTEGDGDKLVFYRAGKKAPPQDIQSLLEEGSGIFRLVKAQA